MSDITNDQLNELINETLEWASDVAEMWAGTLHVGLIDSYVKRISMAHQCNDLETAKIETYDLARVLETAEQEYNSVA